MPTLRLPLPFLFLPAIAAAQYGTGTQLLMGNKRGDINYGCHRVYLGVSTGVNNPTGLAGAQIDVAIASRVSANFGMGIGTWGLKAALEGRYYFEPCNRGFALGLGGTYATGIIDAASISYTNQSGEIETASFDLRTCFNAMLSGYWFRDLGKRGHRFHFQAGYSLPLHGNRVLQRSGTPIDPEARRPLALMPPGGPIVAAGLSFGIGRF